MTVGVCMTATSFTMGFTAICATTFGATPTRCFATTTTNSVFTFYIQELYVLGRKWLKNALVRFVIPFLSLSSADRFIRPENPHRRQNQRRRPVTTNG